MTAKPRTKQPRLHTRIAVNLSIKISATSIEGKTVSTLATIFNVSRGGAALQLNFETDPNTKVKFLWQDQKGKHEAYALTRWKQPCGKNIWKVGVENVDNDSLWSNLIYLACQSRGC
jgi:ribulose kinase